MLPNVQKKWKLTILLTAVALAVLTWPAAATAQAGTLNEARSGHTVTLLPDGRVLVAGGQNESGPLATAEIYDPASGVATVVASSLATPRTGHKAILLEDGWVLLVGGEGADGALDSAEAFDPSSETFVSLAPMNVPRFNHTVTLLPDGRVLVVGGNDGVVPLPWIEIFDPNSDTFILLEAVLLEARESHTATLLKDGRVLVAGGLDGIGALATTEYVDTAALSVEAGPVLTEPRYGHTATRLMSGDVALVYGTDGTWALNTVEILAPDFNDVFMIVNDPNDPNLGRYNHVAVLLPHNGNLLLLGGYSEGGVVDSSAELFNPFSYEFSPFADLQNARAEFRAVAVDGQVWAIGGAGADGASLAGIETLHYATLVTDQIDYPADSDVIFTGSGWLPGETVEILIEESNDVNSLMILAAVADANGNILNQEFNVGPDNSGVSFIATAIGSMSGQVATTTFYDSPNISSLDPSTFAVTDADVSLTISGSGFQPGNLYYNRVYISGPGVSQTLSSITKTSSTIVATIPSSIANQAGNYSIRIRQRTRTCGNSYSHCGSHCCHWCQYSWCCGGYFLGWCKGWCYESYCCGYCPRYCCWYTDYYSNVRTLTITSNQPPVAACQDVVVSAGTDCTADASIDNGSYDPDSDPITLTQDPPGPYGLGDTTVTLTVTDDSGESDSCQATVTVVDTTPPLITCPPDVTVSTDPGVCKASGVNLGTPQASDNCMVASVSNDAPAVFPKGDTVVTWTATDDSGNTATCVQTVTVVDNEPPTITCPANVSVSTDPGLCKASGVNLGTPQASDNCMVASVSNDAPAVFPKGDTVVTWTATDDSGNTATCSQTVTVVDNEPPLITCPPDVTVSTDPGVCEASGVNLGTPQASDNCGVASVSNDAPSIFPKGDTVVTWTATDSSGNTASCQQTVTVVDNEPPTITCPPAITLEGQSPSGVPVTDAAIQAFLAAASATDNCDPSPVITNGAPANYFPLGTTIVTFTAKDASGNTSSGQSAVTVVDTTPPTITYPPDIRAEATGPDGAVVAFTVSATDVVDPSPTVTADPPSGSTFAVGLTVVTVTARDSSGNTATGTATVTVVDTTPPAITCPPAITLEGQSPSGVPVTDAAIQAFLAGASATDICDPAPVIINNAPAAFPLGTTIVTFTATDAFGNASTCQTTVTVVDTTPPVITLNGDASITLECGIDSYTEPGATASDNCDPAVSVVIGGDTVDISTCGAYIVTYNATDASGNAATQLTRTVTVQDTTPPVISLNGAASITLECGIDSYTELGAAVSDAGDPTVTVVIDNSTVDTTSVGTYVVTYNATDASGNAAVQVTRTVVVQDTIDPVISIVAPESYGLYQIGLTLEFTAEDDPGSGIDEVYGTLVNIAGTTQKVYSGSQPGPGVYALTVTAVDNAGNTATSEPLLFVVYDPAGGFATGGGWFYPDAESSVPSGKANFGFVAKYKRGNSTGNLEFQYKDAGINLKSTSIDWLVISATSAQFQGRAAINGQGSYTFRVLTKDNGEPGSGVDHFDIRIWEGTDTEADPFHKAKNTLAGGNIVVHKK